MAVFFLDIQTTGPNPEKGHLLEIAWGETAELIQSFVVKVPGEIPLRILSMTGINESELACAVDPAQIAERLRAFVAARPGAICIIHYAKFEKPFLAALLGEIPFEILCTHELAKRVVPQLPSRGLRGLAGFFGYAKGEQKRASAHVEATAAVWKGLGEKIGEATPEAALRWLGESVPKRQGYTYPIERFKRLDLPAKPGIYRFLNKLGAVLYVGKATSLKDRVNSYFRGRKGRDSRKLEMLTQAWDLEVTECPNILEASMLESDLIKELKPPYNLALKSENKNLLFYSRDFQSCGATCNAEHVVGPFPSSSVLERLCLFCRSAKTGEIDPEIFYEPADSEILQRGYRLFLETHSLTENQARGVRTMIAFGMQKLRRIRVDEEIEAE
ncbi:MAG: GIY-YIG nuclease family protein, partial [Bdellovibrionia bacterium]